MPETSIEQAGATMHSRSLADSPARRRAVIADPVERLRRMIEIRAVEDALNDLYGRGEVRGSIHTCQGQEAVVVAAASVSRPEDYATATYRGHGAALAFGATPLSIVAEVLGRSAGSVGGVGGSMHLADAAVNILPTNAIVGAGLPIAVGAALAAQTLHNGAVSFVFFGDGSTNIGAFHEALNLAAVWHLPVVFICENNLYGEYSPIGTTTSVVNIADRAAGNGIPAEIVDGQELTAMRGALGRATEIARSGAGPAFVEAKTYRYHGHSKADPATYRSADELARWRARDPIDIYAAELQTSGQLTSEALVVLQADVRVTVDDVVQQARSSPPPARDRLFTVPAGQRPDH